MGAPPPSQTPARGAGPPVRRRRPPHPQGLAVDSAAPAGGGPPWRGPPVNPPSMPTTPHAHLPRMPTYSPAHLPPPSGTPARRRQTRRKRFVSGYPRGGTCRRRGHGLPPPTPTAWRSARRGAVGPAATRRAPLSTSADVSHSSVPTVGATGGREHGRCGRAPNVPLARLSYTAPLPPLPHPPSGGSVGWGGGGAPPACRGGGPRGGRRRRRRHGANG